MSYREITVCLEREENTNKLALVASRLGAGLHAYINGVHAIPDILVQEPVAPYIASEVVQQIRDKAKETAVAIKNEFEQVMLQGDSHWQWKQYRCEHYSDYQPYMDYALHSDIVVAGQPPAGSSGSTLQRELLLKIGTPVIVVPAKEDINDLGKRIGVAWNATPEAARAVRDAMPLLANAEEVQIISINGQQNGANAAEARQLTLSQYLEHHQIGSTYHDLVGKNLNISLNLLDHAKTHDLDLLVMGGFGHSRLYDVIVGAATGEVLRNLHIPVFLSH